jgi:hypothetical protein
MPVDAFSDSSLGGTGPSRGSQRAVFYPSPFFDIAGTYFPDTPKALFRYCRYYYYTVGVIGAAVDIHAAYPVTDITIDTEDDTLHSRWDQIINERFHLKSFMVEAGKDYTALGNCFISLFIPFDRHLVCPSCKKEQPIKAASYEFKNFLFQGSCPKCGTHVRYIVKDETVRDLKRTNLVRWSAEHMELEHNPITGQIIYKYNMPNEIRRQIQQGRRHIVETIPIEFIDAAKNNLPVIFNPDNICHLRRPALAEKNQGWGEPAMIRVLKDTFYLQVLRKAREQVAMQHIVPLWVLFPQPMGELNPYEHLNLAEWRERLETEIKKWRQDPNYIPILPIPMGFQFIGGTFKSLDTTPEVQNLLLNILAGMNMPQEFVYGGLQYSGTSFSIRMLANLFSTYRGQLLDFVNNFFIAKISEQFSIKAVKAHFTDLKLADDVQKKTLLLQLLQANKISTHTVLAELGLDVNMEMKKLKEEIKEQGELLGEQMVSQQKAQAAAMLQNIRGQIEGQFKQQQIAMEVQQELMKEKVDLESLPPYKINPDLYSAIFKDDGKGDPNTDEMGKQFFHLNPVSIPATIQSIIKGMQNADEKQKAAIMTELGESMPMLQQVVQEGMAQQGQGQGRQNKAGQGGPLPLLPRPKADMRPQPAQKPPRRAGSN